MIRSQQSSHLRKEGQASIHSTHVHQEADHGRILRCCPVALQFVFQNFACLATPRHGVDVDVYKVAALLPVADSREDGSFIFEN